MRYILQCMVGAWEQTKTVETTQHRYTCAFSYIHAYIQLFLYGTYGSSRFLQPSVSLHTCTVHKYVHHLRLTCWQLAVQTCSFVPSKSKAHEISLSYKCTARCYYTWCTCMELQHIALCAYKCTIKEWCTLILYMVHFILDRSSIKSNLISVQDSKAAMSFAVPQAPQMKKATQVGSHKCKHTAVQSTPHWSVRWTSTVVGVGLLQREGRVWEAYIPPQVAKESSIYIIESPFGEPIIFNEKLFNKSTVSKNSARDKTEGPVNIHREQEISHCYNHISYILLV